MKGTIFGLKLLLFLAWLVPIFSIENDTYLTYKHAEDTTIMGEFSIAPLRDEAKPINESDLIKTLSPLEVVMSGVQLPHYKLAEISGQAPRGIIFTFGLIGNFLAGLVMFQKKNRQTSCYFYMGVLSILDSLPLLLSIPHWIMNDILFVHMEFGKHRLFCQCLWYTLVASNLSGTYIVMAMTFDRLVAVRWPLKAVTWCSMKKAKITSVIIIMWGFLFRSGYIFYTDPVAPLKCVAFQGKRSSIETAYYYLNLIVTCFIPSSFLLTCNVLIILTLKHRGKYFKKDTSSTDPSKPVSQDTVLESNIDGHVSVISHSTTEVSSASNKLDSTNTEKRQKSLISLCIMLLTVSFMYILLTSPLFIFYIIYMFKSYLASPEAYATFNLILVNMYTIFQTNQCINFYVYCLAGSKFRQDLRDTLKHICHRQ